MVSDELASAAIIHILHMRVIGDWLFWLHVYQLLQNDSHNTEKTIKHAMHCLYTSPIEKSLYYHLVASFHVKHVYGRFANYMDYYFTVNYPV